MFQWLCRKRINGLTALNKRLNADLQASSDEIERLMSMLADPKILDIEIEKGSVNLVMEEHWAVKRLAWSFAESLGPAKNWASVQVGPLDTVKGKLLVTIQRMDGLSPVETMHERINQLEAAGKSLDSIIEECLGGLLFGTDYLARRNTAREILGLEPKKE